MVNTAVQGAIPFAVAAVLVRPHPAVLYAYIAARLAENALNHSGIDSPLLDLITLKALPFRASVAFHDAHHKYSNHAFHARNYGESFWVRKQCTPVLVDIEAIGLPLLCMHSTCASLLAKRVT